MTMLYELVLFYVWVFPFVVLMSVDIVGVLLILLGDMALVAKRAVIATHSPGAVADLAEVSKCQKYQHLPPTHCFTPVAFESLGCCWFSNSSVS